MPTPSAPPALKLESAPNIQHQANVLSDASIDASDLVIAQPAEKSMPQDLRPSQVQTAIGAQDRVVRNQAVPLVQQHAVLRPKDAPPRVLSGKLKGKSTKSSIWKPFG